MKENKKTLKLAIALIPIVIYLMISFVNLTIDFSEWTLHDRMSYLFFTIMGELTIVLIHFSD